MSKFYSGDIQTFTSASFTSIKDYFDSNVLFSGDIDKTIKSLTEEMETLTAESELYWSKIIPLQEKIGLFSFTVSSSDALKETMAIIQKVQEFRSYCPKSLELVTLKKNVELCIRLLSDCHVLMRDATVAAKNFNERQEDVAGLFRQISSLLPRLVKFRTVPQIGGTLRAGERLVEWAKLRILEDFQLFHEDHFAKPLSALKVNCAVAESLGLSFVQELELQVIDLSLAGLFSRFNTPDGCALEALPLRLSSFETLLTEFRDKFGTVLPHRWGTECSLAVQFISGARDALLRAKMPGWTSFATALRVMNRFSSELQQQFISEYAQYFNTPFFQVSRLQTVIDSNVCGPLLTQLVAIGEQLVDTLAEEVKATIKSQLSREISLCTLSSSTALFPSLASFIASYEKSAELIFSLQRSQLSLRFFEHTHEAMKVAIVELKTGLISVQQGAEKRYLNYFFILATGRRLIGSIEGVMRSGKSALDVGAILATQKEWVLQNISLQTYAGMARDVKEQLRRRCSLGWTEARVTILNVLGVIFLYDFDLNWGFFVKIAEVIFDSYLESYYERDEELSYSLNQVVDEVVKFAVDRSISTIYKDLLISCANKAKETMFWVISSVSFEL